MKSPTGQPRVHLSARPAGRLPRVLGAIGLAVLFLLTLWVSMERPAMHLENVITEKWVVPERIQLVLWLSVIACTTVAAARAALTQGLLLALWLGVTGSLAVMRELDLHAVLNPPNVHLLGLKPEQAVRFRSDWILDPEVSLLLKLAWGGVFVALGAAVLAPFIAARYRWVRKIWRKQLFPCLIAGGVFMLFLGYAADDLLDGLREGTDISLSRQEEWIEVIGVAAFLAAAAVLAVFRGPDRPVRSASAPVSG